MLHALRITRLKPSNCAFTAFLVYSVATCFIATSSAQEGFSNGFPTKPNFFPIGVWLQSPIQAPSYKLIGINTFVGLWKGPTEIQLKELFNYNMLVIAAQNDVALNSNNRNLIKGWLHEDEPDNAQPTGLGLHGSCIPPVEVVRRSREMKSRDPTRPVMVNFGQGIANEFWRGRGPCSDDLKYYDVASEGADILSFDIYPVGSSTPQVKGKLEYVARGVERLVRISNPKQRVWAVIETTALDPDHRVMPSQIRSEVWMAIIHGAKGIVYFVHEFKPNFREDAIFRYPDIVSEVRSINEQIQSLAPVLNNPNIPDKVTVDSSEPIAMITKTHDKSLYIFTVAMKNIPTTSKFSLHGINAKNAEVIGEKRSIPVRQGAFEDSFAGYGVHLYRLPLN